MVCRVITLIRSLFPGLFDKTDIPTAHDQVIPWPIEPGFPDIIDGYADGQSLRSQPTKAPASGQALWLP